MLRFVLRKLLNKKWMVLSLLIGNILMISITCSNPMYTNAMLQKVLTKQMESYLSTNNEYPGVVYSKVTAVPKRLDLLLETQEASSSIADKYGVPCLYQVSHYFLNPANAQPELSRGKDASNKSYTLGFLSDMESHIIITSGRMYSTQPDEEGIVDVLVSERGFIEMELLLDEVIAFPKLVGPNGEPLRVRVVGVFTNSAADDPYWVESPSEYQYKMLMPESMFRELFILTPETQALIINAQWYTLLDYTQIKVDDVDRLLSVTEELSGQFSSNNNLHFRAYFSPVLDAFLKEAARIRVTLLVLQVPILVLLAAFIFMVARQMLDMEQAEISVIKSRGAGKIQIISVYLVQSLVLSLSSFVIALPVGIFLCQMLGSSNAFLEFVQRKSLEIKIDSSVLLYGAAAALFSILTMVLPVFRYSKVSIVNQKQKKNRKSDTPMWQKLFLDFIILGLSLYGLYNFNNQKAYLAERVLSGESLDPTLFLSSSLFMIGAGLVALRIIPIITWCIYQLFKKWWSPALYASFLRVLRTRASQGFIMVFIMLTIALGIFNAQTARSINSNKETNIRYVNGADLVVMDYWNSTNAAEGSGKLYDEPDYSRYTALDGVESITKVQFNTNIQVGKQKNVTLMAINTKEFGETAYFPGDLTDEHWYHMLNRISQDASGVLISRSFQTDYGYEVGDTITYQNAQGQSIRGVIYGIVDYFPGFAPSVYSYYNGTAKVNTNYLIVAHLAQVQSEWGITPYQIWMKTRDSSQFIYDFATENKHRFHTFKDTAADIVALKNDPVFQGTNGILTVSFIVVLILCCAGFLIYWIMSIRSRTLQFGIYRAMGLSMREILTMLLNEQFFISGLSIAIGTMIGFLATKLYIPLIQIAYTAADQTLPLTIYTETADMVRLFSVVGVMILICMLILGTLISRMKIAQALKLGED